ncbi:hypothetical protein D8B26_005625 [Coccidioides posadasii str. Silveira]|uniref:uncharacterized protein n=1 Tax=Coccidioides posadasii (strain RMSCC 757 / Silveira) TaxID=443226 RepID=UPI001BEEF9B7|nr:hypothetical protein D8B26_005625 [Coccidioides posadasii str. Silveira]
MGGFTDSQTGANYIVKAIAICTYHEEHSERSKSSLQKRSQRPVKAALAVFGDAEVQPQGQPGGFAPRPVLVSFRAVVIPLKPNLGNQTS